MLLHKLRRKKAQQATPSLEHERLASLVNSMADGVIAIDEQTRVVMYNGAAMNILNSNDSIEKKRLGDIFKPIDANDQPVNIRRLVKAATVPITNRDLRLEYDDSSIINVYISIAPVRLGFGEQGLRGYVVLLRDITREKSLEEERDEFISVASHELRTPIAITEGNISNARFIAEHSKDLNQIRQALEEAHSQILFLAELVNDLSMLSRAERGKLPMDAEQINVADFAKEIIHNYEHQAMAKGLELTSDVQVSDDLYSSKLYVREILQNFITNAIKYTEHGHVTLIARDAPNGIAFSIADTGIGISQSDQKRVFRKFFRSEDFRTRKNPGTGLGLYVTAKLARLLQASISLESEIDKGSTFTITVPNIPVKVHTTGEKTNAHRSN